jgi:iron complex outermembrane recepter protein
MEIPLEGMMASNPTLLRAVKLALVVAGAYGATSAAQDAEMEQIVVTGTRITLPGVESSSPITTIGANEIRLQQRTEVEQILRVLPITLPADGGNVNNGTAGVATVNLRGLGTQRNLVLMDGKRLTPYNINGLVDTSIIPTPLIERLDIVTGGASAVYGSDAISGALNFIMKKDFEGVEVGADYSTTEKGDGTIETIYAVLGANVADGRGNVVLGINWSERQGVQLGQRALGQLGIVTSDGSGYEEFLAGEGPPAPPPGCGGPGSVAAGGSTTTVPTRVAISGGPGLGQFRDDGTLGSNCGVFNFNPFNYYQTPQEKFGGLAMASFEINEQQDESPPAGRPLGHLRQLVLHPARQPVHRGAGPRCDPRYGERRCYGRDGWCEQLERQQQQRRRGRRGRPAHPVPPPYRRIRRAVDDL